MVNIVITKTSVVLFSFGGSLLLGVGGWVANGGLN